MFLVTGAAGFIGSHFVDLLIDKGHNVIVLDKLTYAGNRANLNKRASFCEGDICNTEIVRMLLNEYHVDAVFNFAAESHVCRSINEPETFIRSNIGGTFTLLNESLKYWQTTKSDTFKYIQISTDEVYGELGPSGKFSESSPHRPNSPYAASKSGGDHLVAAWVHTYAMPAVITNCSNNYGPRQYPEKLIPITIKRILEGTPIEVHGNGKNIRDWIHVQDHCEGVWLAFERGIPGKSYCFGGDKELTNIEIIQHIMNCLPNKQAEIRYVADRLGNDKRYAIDDTFARTSLGWKRRWLFEDGIRSTVNWYHRHRDWLTIK